MEEMGSPIAKGLPENKISGHFWEIYRCMDSLDMTYKSAIEGQMNIRGKMKLMGSKIDQLIAE